MPQALIDGKWRGIVAIVRDLDGRPWIVHLLDVHKMTLGIVKSAEVKQWKVL